MRDGAAHAMMLIDYFPHPSHCVVTERHEAMREGMLAGFAGRDKNSTYGFRTMSDIKLPAGGSPGEIHGYFRTAEGREFLRSIYPAYLEYEQHGEWKVASIIADNNFLAQVDETLRVRAALTRWRTAKTKVELYKDAEISLRLLEKLEVQMMKVEVIKQILDDRAADIHKRDIGSALSILFFGTVISKSYQKHIDKTYEKICGLFHVQEHEMRLDNLVREYFLYFKRPEASDFLLVHEFEPSDFDPSQESLAFRYRKSGYALPDDGGGYIGS